MKSSGSHIELDPLSALSLQALSVHYIYLHACYNFIELKEQCIDNLPIVCNNSRFAITLGLLTLNLLLSGRICDSPPQTTKQEIKPRELVSFVLVMDSIYVNLIQLEFPSFNSCATACTTLHQCSLHSKFI